MQSAKNHFSTPHIYFLKFVIAGLSLVVLVCLFIIFVNGFFYLNVDLLRAKAGVRSTPAVLPKEKFEIFVKGPPGALAKNGNVVLAVKADSNGQNISGFDLLIGYDNDAFNLVKASPQKTQFAIYPYQRNGYLAITGTKMINVNETTIFKEDEVIELVFQAKSGGRHTFSLEPAIGRETTKMVDGKANILNVQTNEITVDVD